MIYIPRDRVKKPKILDSDRAKQAQKDASDFFLKHWKRQRQTKYNFNDQIYTDSEVVHALSELFCDKCAFCETKLGLATYSNILHFRPMHRTVDLKGNLFPKHYWWLAYTWENLYIACPICTTMKGSRFPIKGSRASETDDISSEWPLLLDPCHLHQQELIFDKSGQVSSTTEREQTTIQVFSLNRRRLVRARRSELQRLYVCLDRCRLSRDEHSSEAALIPEIVANITAFVDKSSEFAAMKRQHLRMWLLANEKLPVVKTIREALENIIESWSPIQSEEVTSNKIRQVHREFLQFQKNQEKYSLQRKVHVSRYFAKTRLIERIIVHNFRVIQHMKLQLSEAQSRQAPWTVFIGENGTGKSSILQAVALTLAGEEYRSSLFVKPSDVLRHGCKDGYVKVFLTGRTDPITLIFRRGSASFEGNPSEPRVLLLGYGATRLLPRKGKEPIVGKRYANINNIFSPFIPLKNPEAWLLSLPKDTFENVALAMKELLCLKQQDKLIRCRKPKPAIRVQTYGHSLLLEELSDGYQTVVALVSDIMYVMLNRWKAMDIAEGVVLLDEIGSHLHPRWKMRIVQSLRTVFPRVQFLAATHDPLCLRGLFKNEVVVMCRNSKNRIVPVTDLPCVDGLRVDQLLTSEYFGLNSTVDPDLEKLFEEYYGLLKSRSLSTSKRAKLSELKGLLQKYDLMGSTRRERLMLEAVDEYLAYETELLGSEEKQMLKGKTLRKIAKMWNSLGDSVTRSHDKD